MAGIQGQKVLTPYPVRCGSRMSIGGFLTDACGVRPQESCTRAHGFDGALLVRNRAAVVWVDPRDASVVRVQRTVDLSALERWIDTADPIHFTTCRQPSSSTVCAHIAQRMD